MGMLMYLASKFHPDIAFSLQKCANLKHALRQSHAKLVKHIIQYIKDTEDK